MKRIFVTGGHFAPAKAVIQELLRRNGWQIYYLGRKYSLEGSRQEALEYSEIGSMPVHYLTITTGRIQRQFFINIGQSILAFLKIFVGLVQSLAWLVRYQPDIVLSFGGYVAVPVAFWAWFLGIPVVTHEQTLAPGRANRLLFVFAKKILVSWPGSIAHFPRGKVILTGNPLRREILDQRPVPSNQLPVIYITGGSQGSQAIDAAVLEVLPQLQGKYQIIRGRLSGEESAQVLAKADLVVARAGANTVAEILFFGKPAILIPLPHTYGDEQEKNAHLVADVGLGEILDQKKLTGKTLLQLISHMMTNRQKYLANAKRARSLLLLDSASRIVDVLQTF